MGKTKATSPSPADDQPAGDKPNSGASAAPTPTIGRIVLFRSHGDETPWPAIVQDVKDDGSVLLFVFGRHVGHACILAVAEGETATFESSGSWTWPPRQ